MPRARYYNTLMELDAAKQLGVNRAALSAALAEMDALAEPVQRTTQLLSDTLLGGGKLLCCGNGGSAADAAHFASELAGRYKLDRPGFPALDLSAEHTLVTSLSNDYPPAEMFARQVRTFGQPGDVLAGFSTSGQSENIRQAFEAARAWDLHTVGFLDDDGGRCRELVDIALLAPVSETARVQELHLLLYHTICQTLDPVLARAGHAARSGLERGASGFSR